MKKVLSVFFAILFVMSALSVCASAFDADSDWQTTCPYCGDKFTSEIEYAKHMELYNFKDGHYVTCPYTGEDYKDGGCGEKFATKDAYDLHVENCKHNGDYSVKGYLKVFLGYIWDSIKGADWGALFGGIVSIVKALVKGVPFGEVVDTVKGMF